MVARFTAPALEDWLTAVFARAGLPADDAAAAAGAIIQAELYGFTTHGLNKLNNHLERLENGVANPRAAIKVLKETPVSARLDADLALGFVAAPRAMDLAIAKAKAAGLALVTVGRATTMGACGVYSPRALPADMIGFAATNGRRGPVPPAGGRDGFFSTDPFSIAIPAGAEPPFLLDMSCSVVAMTRVMQRQDEKRELEPGWAIDAAGNPTTDPEKFHALLPLGSFLNTGAAKGTGLAIAVEALTGLIAAGSGPHLPAGARPERGMCALTFAAVRLDLFREPEEFKREMDCLLRQARQVAPRPGAGPLRLPGERAFAEQESRRRSGIPLDEEVVALLAGIGQKAGRDLPPPAEPRP